MYRVESFLTSFILSYADKYIKNFKRSDAQLHLWEGQACFHNLELDLEALESLVPFHFVSGHINELRIKVPWTSLGSSSVEVVIDTIECVMKFKSGQNDTDSNNAATSNSPHRDSQPSPSPSPTLDPNLPSLEPGTGSLTPVESSNSTYMISLVRRVLSNLKIVCNNVILKIIEEDTVLSLNIKTIQCDSVDEKWLPAFTELSPKDLFLRKRIKLLDITICLDRRSSSGHIVTFLEPLLFKCSLEMRLCQQFDKNYETRLTRLDVCCDKMRYIVSKPQLYLLLKILELVVNLKKVISKSKLNSSHGGPQPPSSPTGLPPSPPSSPTPASPQRKEPPLSSPTPLLPESSGGEEVGWFGWAWRLIPSLLVDEELGPALPRDAVTGHTLRIGLYIKQLQLSLKLRECTQSSVSDKVKYAPLMSLQIDGLFAELTSHNDNWFNLQAGIDNILVSSNGTCPCGVKSMDEVLITTSQTIPDQTEVLNLTSKPTCSKWQRTKQKVNQVKDSLQNLGEKFGNSAIKLAEDSYVHLTTALSVDNIGGAEPPCLRPARDTVSPTCDVDPSVSRKSPEPDPGPDTSARGGIAESTSPPPLQGDPFLDGSLFSPHVKFVPLSKPFWQDHLASVDEVAMLNRSRTMYIDLVKSLELVSVDKETEGEDDVNDIGIMQEKMLLRCVLGPMLVKLNASLVHRTLYLVTLLQESLNSISLFASSDEKKTVSLSDEQMELYAAGFIPFNIIQIAIFHPIIELHPLAQHSAGCTPGPQHDLGGPHPQPHLVIGFEYADMRLTYPMHGDLVREYLSRSGNESGAVVRDLYRKLCADVTGITVNACFTKDSQMKTEQLLTLGKLVVTGTSNQFCENEVAELQEFFRSTLQNKEFHLQDLKLSLRDKNVQVQCNLDSLNLHFNLHTHHIATHVLHSLHHFMTGMEEKTVRGYLGFNVLHDCDTLTVCLTLDSISGQWLRTRLFTCVNLTVASVGGRILKRNRYNEVTYENCVLQSGNPDSGPDKASNAQSGSSPSQPNKVAQTPDIPSHPTLTLLLQIPSQWPPNAKNTSDVKNPAATWEKSSKNPSAEKSPCSKIPPICVFKLRDLSFLADVYLYQMVNYWSPPVVSIAEGPGFDGDQQNTQNSSGLGLSRQISGGGGSQTNSSLFHTPPASLNHASYVAPPLQQDSVYSSEPSGRGSSYKATSVGTGAKLGATPREIPGSKLIKHYHIWKCLIMSIQMDNIRVYFPIKPVRNTLAPFDALNSNVIVVKVPSVVVHSLNRNIVVDKLPTIIGDPAVWSTGKLNFPWSVKISNVISYTTILTSTNSNNSNKKHRMELYLLKPLDVTCSIAVNIKQEPMQEADGDKLATSVPSCIQSIAFTIHINTSRVDVNICEPQVDLIHQLLNLYVLEFLSNLRSSEPWPSGDHARNGTADCHLQSDVKLSALVQWTLARMVVNLRTVSSSPSQECRKIALEIQELIVSMDYQPPSYQMIKFKMADAAVHHFKRLNFEDPWSLGDYQGVIMKVNETESRSSNGKSAAEDTSGGFLTITLTRANSDNLHSKIGTRDRVHKFNKYMCIPSVHLNTITEIIIKVQPLDFILAPSTISTFLDILSPLIRSNRGTSTRQLVSSKSATYLCAKEDLDRQEFSLNREEFNLKEEELYPEKFNLSQQRLELNEDKTNWKKEEFNSNFEELSLNSEEFSLNQDQSNAERIGATIKESNCNQRFGAPSDVQTRMSGSRDRSENFLSASVPSPFGTRREGSIDKTPLRKQSGTSQERQIRGSSEPTTRESKYSASWESTPGEHDGQKSVQNIRGERDGRESVEKGRSRYTECSALRMDAKATVPREEGRNEGCDTSLRMDVTSMDVKYDMKTLEEIREMKMDEKQVRLSENAQLGYQSFPRERNQRISHAGKSEGTFENSEENPANLAEFSSETEGIFGPEGIPHSSVHTGVKVERPLYGDRPVPSGPIDPGLEVPGATAWGRKTNPPLVVPGKRLRKISSASTIGSSEYAPVHRKVSQEKTGADLSSAKKVTQSLIGADLTSSVERKVPQSMQEERIFSKRFSTQASISESDVLTTELGASHHEPPLYPEEISPPKEAETSQIDHFQSETLVRKPKEAPRERSIDPRKISSSILKKTSSSSLGESFATKKVSLDLPTDHLAMSPAKPKVPFVSTARLPLLFLDVKNVRVIIPLEAIESGQAKREKVGGRNVASAGKTNGEADRISGGGSDLSRGGIPTSDPPLSPGGNTSLPLILECLHDCVIVTLGGISISPQVDNPLCRVECRPDLLGLARKFGVDHVLGSQIEDRQYQLDVGTIGVSSGIWSELERGTLLSHTSELELNAALIWNSGQTPGAAPNTLPLLREFSLIATLAPSIVYLYEAVIVAGTSLEINAAKDIHFSLTLAQLRLLSHLHRQLDSHLLSHLRKHSAKLPRNTAHCTRNFGDTSPVTRNFGDSNSALEGRQSAGMGRTQSHVEVGQSHLGAGQSNVGAGQSHVGVGQSKAGAGHNQVGVGQNTASVGQSSNVPFEMLVTGRSILVDLFDKEDNIRPMACLHLIQPDLLVKTNSLQVQASEHTIFNIYDIKVYINKSYETPTGYYDNQDSASLAEDPKLDETDADSIEGDKSRLTKLIRDKIERQKRHEEILARDQIPLLETGTVPERKRQENGLCPVLIQVKLERTLVGKRLTGSVQKPVRLVLTEELLTRFNTVRSKINAAIHTSPNPTHGKGDQSTNCSTDTLSRGTKYRRHIEKLKVKLEAYGLSEMTLTTDQMTLIVNHLESDLPSLCLNLSSGLLSLSHPFSSHLHISTLSLSTQLTSTCPPRFLVDPMEVKVGLDCAWESWYPTFLMFLNGNIEYVSVNISAYQLEVLYRIYHQYKRLLPTRHTSNNRGDPTANSTKDSGDSVPNISSETAHSHVITAKETASHVTTAKETTDFDGATLLTNAAAKVASGFEGTATPSAANCDAAAKGTPSFNAVDLAEPDQDQHYVDDLRAGAFQYIPVPDTSTRLPLSYQILYNAYSITWKYPSPRSITRIYIAPVPSLEETPNQADYLLQYYDSSKGFTVYARLKVVENSDEVAKVDFFDVPPLKPVSEVWRIVHEDHVNEDLDMGRVLTEARSVGNKGKADGHLSRGNEGLSGVSGVEVDGNGSGKTPREDGSRDDVQGTNNDSEDRRAHHCNMQLLLGSIRVDSFYSYKLISNLHINLDNKVFKLNLLHSGNNGMRYILNKKKLLFRKFKLNEQNAQLFSDDYTIAQFGCTNNRLKYDLNVNFAAGLYLTRVQTGSMAVSLINYNLLTLKPVLEVIQVNANLYNGEYNSKKHTDNGGINIDLIISDHIKCNMSNDFVTSASVVRKVIHRTLNQMKAVTFQSQKDREERLRDANVGEVNGLRSVGDGKHNEESAGQKQSLRPTQANSEIPESNIPIPREQKTDIDFSKAFDSSDTTEAEPSRTKPIQKLKTGHKDLLAGSETSGLPVLDLDDLSDPLYGGSTSGFQSVTQEHICRHCPNCADWKVDNAEHRTEAVDPNNTGTIEAEKGTLPVMPEPTEAGMLNDGEFDVDIMLTSVMICNNTHIPFIVRQYDTTRESVVYSMECVYFSWFKSPSPNTSRQHWLEFNIKSADFQWSSPLALNAETKGQHPLYVRGPNGKLFPVVVEVGDCDNSKVVTIHGNLHCANLFNRDLHFLLLCHGGENQLVQVPAKTVSPSVILSPVADISKYEMKIKIQDSVWSGTIPIGANMSAKLGSGEDLWLVKLPLPPSSPSSFESVWVRLLWDHRDTSSADLYRCVFVVTSLYMIRSYLPSPSLIRVTSRRDSAQCVPGKGQLAELNIPNCTSQDTHQVCFQLTQSTKVTTPALQVSYKTVEHNAPPYSELTAQSALDILYNYQLELPGGEESPPCAQTDTLIDQITRRIVPEYMDTPSVLSFTSQSNLGSSETSSSLGNGRSSSQIPPSNIEKSSNNHQSPPSIGGKYHQIPPSASEKSSNPKTSLPPLNIWESSLEGIPHLWPFSTHYTTARPTDTLTHIDIQYTPVPLYNHCLCVTLKPWALLFNSLPVEIALRRDSSDAGPDSCSREEISSSPTRGNLWRGATLSPRRTPASRDPMLCPRERSSPAQHSVFLDPPRGASSSHGENFSPDASILCSLDRHSVLSPPRLDSSFWVCLLLRGRRFQSTCSLELRSSQAFYTPKVSGLLFPNSFVYVDVLCEEYMAYITLTSSEFDNIRVLNLQPVYSAANHSSYPLDVQGFVVYPGSLRDPESRDRFQIPHHYPEVLRLQPGQRSGGRNEPRPLLFWKILGPYAPDETPEFYLIFWMNGIPLCPVLLSTLDVKRAHPLCISNQGSPIGLTLTTSVQNGVHQFLVWDNDLPQLVLNNRTDMSLSISPCYADPKKVPPMAFLWKWYMNPRSVSYYSLPEDHTPDSVSSAEVELPPLMLELEDPTSGSMSSELLVLTECSGRLVHLASTDFKVNIVKEVHSRVVTIEMASSGEISAMDIRKRLALAFTSEERRPLSNNPEVKDSAPATTVTRDSANSSTAQQDSAYSLTASRGSANSSTAHQDSAYSLIASQNAANSNTAQQDSAYSITAIRDSANSGPAQRIVPETLDVTRTPEHSQSFSPGQNPFNASRSITAQRSQGESYFLYLLHSYNFHLKMYVHNAHCRFLEDVQQAALMVVNLDKVLVAMKNGHYKRQASAGYKFTETSVVVNNIQVDNTLYKYGKYDFNVILFKNISNSNASRVKDSELFETTVAQLKRLNSVEALMNYLIQPNHCDHENFLNLQVNFHSTPRLYLLDLIRVHINTPFILRIEDVYLSRLNAYWKRLLRLKLSPPSEESGDPSHNPALPLATTAGYELAFPLRIGTISIEAFTLSLCLHTSSRFYIALDNSPLSFARFERNALVTSSYRLGQAISLHYFLNAIYATGWAIGRLEFCGTPGGLARSVGTGIRDFLTLPYQALGSGPTGFILGLYHGSGSLLRHTAGGTLTSVIKAAASWSRTLDRLTLDEEDLQHTEEIRRRRPVNLTQGLMQGLTEFGISILGAIGGLAYHPIQYAVSGPGSNTTLATSLGKSVMGVISRPLSGAAELVALTGEGFLSTVGWTSIPQLRPELSSLTHELSPLKFLLPSPILYLAEATLYTPADSPTLYRHVCLVITPSDVTLIREDNGDVIDSMGVGGVRWGCDKEDDTRLVLAIQTDTEVHSFAKSRVLSYVQSTTSELFPTTPPSHSTNHSAEFSTNEITSSISGTVSEGHVLFLDPTLKRTVCNVLETLKMFLELRN